MKPQFLISRAAALLLCAALLLLSGCAAQASTPAPSPVVSASPAPAVTEAACSPSPAPQASPSPVSDEAAVTALVQAFGKTLQTVSLLDEAGVASAMQAAYGQYVTPELLEAWQAKPAQAPGRMVSSPCRIISTYSMYRKNRIPRTTVTGQIVEITSDSPEAAARRAITLTAEKQADGTFRITAVTLEKLRGERPCRIRKQRIRVRFYYPPPIGKGIPYSMKHGKARRQTAARSRPAPRSY
jgi:hypothetical protein